MKELSNRTWTLQRITRPQHLKALRLTGCTFDNCSVALTAEPERMTRVSDVELLECTTLNCQISACILTDVTVHHLKTGDLMLVWAPLLTHVTLAGKLGRIKINELIRLPGITAEQEATWRARREAHYAQVDWALDISAARPLLLELAGIPASTIRRDPETQMVVSKTRLKRKAQLDALTTLDDTLRFTLESFVVNTAPDAVLVAPTGRAAKAFRPILEGFAALRRAGLAEPD